MWPCGSGPRLFFLYSSAHKCFDLDASKVPNWSPTPSSKSNDYIPKTFRGGWICPRPPVPADLGDCPVRTGFNIIYNTDIYTGGLRLACAVRGPPDHPEQRRSACDRCPGSGPGPSIFFSACACGLIISLVCAATLSCLRGPVPVRCANCRTTSRSRPSVVYKSTAAHDTVGDI